MAGAVMPDVPELPITTHAGAQLPSIGAEALGGELARSVRQRAEQPARGVGEFARAYSLDAERVQAELTYLSIVTMQFCIGAGLPDHPRQREVGVAFYAALWAGGAWRADQPGLASRIPHYETALNNPDPALGRAYGMGRAFARLCGASHDVPVIEFGARAYVEQLAPILELLRGVAVA